MEKLIVSEVMANGIQGTKVVEEKPTAKYKKVVEEANERIRENRRREAEAWIKASTYISD
jgi:hypothetical protein